MGSQSQWPLIKTTLVLTMSPILIASPPLFIVVAAVQVIVFTVTTDIVMDIAMGIVAMGINTIIIITSPVDTMAVITVVTMAIITVTATTIARNHPQAAAATSPTSTRSKSKRTRASIRSNLVAATRSFRSPFTTPATRPP